MNIDMYNLMSALKLMWQGMLGIFVVMAAIAIIVFILTKVKKK